MGYLLWCVFPTLLVLTRCSTLDIARDEEDTTFGWIECTGFDRTIPAGVIYRTCSCQSQYTTMMSKENQIYSCFTPAEVGCDYYLTEDRAYRQAYLLTNSHVNRQIVSPNGKTVNNVQRVLVWNLHPEVEEIGNWVDITNRTEATFSLLNVNSKTSLDISNLPLNTWEGFVIKIELGIEDSSRNCMIVKVKGRTTYPIDVYKQLAIRSTTVKPPTTKPQHKATQVRVTSTLPPPPPPTPTQVRVTSTLPPPPPPTPRAVPYPWILQETDVCFGARSRSHGTFIIKQNGMIVAMRLVHKSGYLNCRQSDPSWRSNWGCKGIRNSLSVFVTDQNNGIVFPKGVTFINGFYRLPGYNENDNSVVFTDSASPMYTTRGSQLRLFYGADLLESAYKQDNDGTACVDVYAKFNSF